MKRYLSSIIICLTLFVGEIHTFWEGGAIRTQNWIWANPRPMALQWNIKFVSDQINWILIALALFFYKPNKLNQTCAASYIAFQIADTFLYFYNYKTYGYGYIYLGVALFGFLYYKLK